MKAWIACQKSTEDDVGVLRTEKVLIPGCGLEFYDLLLGKRLTKDVQNGSGVQLSDFLLL